MEDASEEKSDGHHFVDSETGKLVEAEIRNNLTTVHCHDKYFDAADSDDEARGRAARAARTAFPPKRGFTGHFAMVVRISDLDLVAQIDIDSIQPANMENFL